MTCIVGLVEKGTVYIGGDSASVSGWTSRVTRLPKVIKKGPFLLGYTTSFRMGQLLEHSLHVPAQAQTERDDMRYMVTVFVEHVRQLLKDRGMAKVEANSESGGQFLVAYRRRLFSIQSDFQVNEMADGYDAVGSGAEYALGAMTALKGVAPVTRIKRALAISSKFNMGVCPPFFVRALRG